MNWCQLLMSVTLFAGFMWHEKEKYKWLKTTIAYITLVIFVLYWLSLTQEGINNIVAFISNAIMLFMIYLTVIGNSSLLIKSFRLAKFKGNLLITVANILQIIISLVIFYKFFSLYSV